MSPGAGPGGGDADASPSDGGRGAPDGPSTGVRVKICGVGRPRDVDAAAEAGAHYVGLVLAESPRRLDEPAAGRLAARASEAGMRPVGVFVDRPPGEVRGLAERLGLPVAQLHGDEPPGACRSLRAGGLEVWKAVRPAGREELLGLADRYREAADALLVEGHSPEAAGGTGTGFPWSWLLDADGGRVVERLVLAGGLDAGNVAAAVRRTRPDVVDVSSGVEEAPGRKDPARIRAFVEAARGALDPGAGAGGNGP